MAFVDAAARPARRGKRLLPRLLRRLARAWDALAAGVHDKVAPNSQHEVFSLVEALYVLLLRVWRRPAVPFALLLCAALLLALAAPRSPAARRAGWRAIPPGGGSLVFTAPIAGSFVLAHSDLAPKFIPRVIHQTYPSLELLPRDVAAVRQSWMRLNPGWQVRFWDDASCLEFVHREFPEYYRTYVALPKNVERADFFRYLVVLRYGGVYADIDAELRQPLDDVIRSTDMLVVGWEAEAGDDAEMLHRHLARRRQARCATGSAASTYRRSARSRALRCGRSCHMAIQRAGNRACRCSSGSSPARRSTRRCGACASTSRRTRWTRLARIPIRPRWSGRARAHGPMPCSRRPTRSSSARCAHPPARDRRRVTLRACRGEFGLASTRRELVCRRAASASGPCASCRRWRRRCIRAARPA